MRVAAVLAVLAIGGCTQAQTAVDTAADVKRQANDLQTQIWLLETCDQSLGGLQRNAPREAQEFAINYCFSGDRALPDAPR